ncbi:MAG: cytochrome c3 family protein [Hyphomicrobiales bacterium]
MRSRTDSRSPRLRVVLGALALGLALAPGASRAQVSPGPLARAHHAWDNLASCFQCHSRSGSMSERCLACHTEIAWSQRERRGFHATVSTQECAKCHPDHAGEDFAMITWDEGSPDKFRHDRAGWTLTGKHATLACRACHAVANQKSPVTSLIRKKNHAESWLGLDTRCASCHEDPHKGRFGDRCETCHRTERWGEINQEGFDHDKTRYPLRGRHASLACASCHDAKTAWGPKPAFSACGSCHRDAHAGQATLAGKPADCAACHDVNGFRPSTFTVGMHRKTAYPLRGAHVRVDCARCHVRPAGAEAAKLGTAGVVLHPAGDRCERCHAGAHGDLLPAAGAKAARTACADCHGEDSFRPSRFTVADHAKVTFRLDGTHATTDCRACHGVDRAGLPPLADAARAGKAAFVFAIPEAACADCHADPHKGRFAAGGAKAFDGGCAACHGTKTFRPASYDAERHAHAAFPLEGAHRAVPCAACHADLAKRPAASSLLRAKPNAAGTPLLFAVEKRACADCHQNPHGDQFRGRRDHGACDGCHGLDAFTPASRFDHDKDASFHLKGAHANVACARCHKTDRDRAGNRRVAYKGVPARCEDCHAT